MKNVYIAGRFSNRVFYREIATKLIQNQYAVTSRWVWDDDADFYDLNSGEHKRLGERDLVDIDAAHLLIIDTEGALTQGSGGGREVELGYAFGRGREIWRVGPSRNVFHDCISMTFRNWQEALNYVKR